MARTDQQSGNNIEDSVKKRIVAAADSSLGAIEDYLGGKDIEPEKVNFAFKMVNQATKILHMNQVRSLTERSQALRLLPWLRDDTAREEYIRVTNPKAAPMLLGRPEKKVESKST